MSDRIRSPDAPPLGKGDDVQSPRVLIIAPDDEGSSGTQRALADIPWLSCVMECVNSYPEALRALRGASYDVILLDRGLRSNGGRELLEEAFGASLPTAIVLLTGARGPTSDAAMSSIGIAELLERSERDTDPLAATMRYALERIRLEADLRSSRAYFRSAFDAFEDRVAILDGAGMVVAVNRAWRASATNDFCGASAVPGDNYFELCSAEGTGGNPDATALLDGLRAVLHGPRKRFSYHYSDGAPEADRRFRADVISMAEGPETRIVVSHHDITLRMRAEREQREREERYRLAGRATKDVLWDWDLKSHEVVWGEMITTVFGYAMSDEMSTSHWWAAHVHPDDMPRIVAELTQVQRSDGDTWSAEYRFRRSDGSYCEVLDRAFVLRDSDGVALRMIGSMTDLTEQREAQAQLRESEARHRLLFHSNPSPLWVAEDGTMRCIWANDAALAQYGYTPDEFYTLTAWDIRVPSEWSVLDGHATVRPTGLNRLGSARHRRKNGEIIDVDVVLHSIELGGKPCQLILATDVTERKRIERAATAAMEQLEFERNRLSRIFEQAPAFMGVMRGKHNVYEMVNDELIRLLGKNPIGQSFANAMPEAAERGFLALVDTVRETGEPYVGSHVAAIIRDPEGVEHKYTVNLMLQPLVEADGSVSGVLVHGVDVTGQIDAADALRQSEEQYRSLVEMSPDGILIHVDGTIVFANNSAAQILRAATPAGLVGRRFIERVHGDEVERVQARMDTLTAGHAVPRAAVRWLTLDGAARDMDVSSTGFEFQGRAAIQTIFRDTTDRRQLEEQLRQAQKMEAVGQLAGGVAHDFNNLLTVIKVNVEFMLEGMNGESTHFMEASDVRDAADRAAALTRQLLAYSRKQILQPRALDCNDVVKGVQPMLSRLIREDIEVQMNLAPRLGAVMADPGQLEQVLINLSVNARDAMPGGGLLLIETEEVTLSAQWQSDDLAPVVPGRYVMITISDTGTGISQADQQHIFEPFFTTKAVGAGTGLGLATVHGIVKQSGGHLHVISAPAEGTTISVYLPVVPGAPHVSANVRAVRNVTGTETILLVEDMDALRMIARRVLSRCGYRVLEARNGREALEISNAHVGVIALVLTDVVMPEMNGVQLVQSLKQARPELKVLFMSGYADDELARHTVIADGAVFIPKPFSPVGLLQVVRETLDEVLPMRPAS